MTQNQKTTKSPAPKTEFNKEQQKTERADLPDILSLAGIPDVDAQRIAELLETGAQLKHQIGKKPDHKKGTDGVGLLDQLDAVTEELTQLQIHYSLAGMRHGRFVFVSTMRDGRETLDKKKFAQELIARFAPFVKRGTDVIAIVNEATVAATKTGDPYLVRELEILE